jgi:hypothetical protein
MIQRYLSGIPSFISDKIQYDDPEILEKTIRRVKFLYDQHRGIPTFPNAWEDNRKRNMEQRRNKDNQLLRNKK